MKQVPEDKDIFLHIMKIKTDQLEYIGDDEQYIVHANVLNAGMSGQHDFEIRLHEQNASPKALAHGGLAIWSNITPEILRRATVMGLEYLSRTGQLSTDSFVEGGLEE